MTAGILKGVARKLPWQRPGDTLTRCGRTFTALRYIGPRGHRLEWEGECCDCGEVWLFNTRRSPWSSHFYARCPDCRAGKVGKQATAEGREAARVYLHRQATAP